MPSFSVEKCGQSPSDVPYRNTSKQFYLSGDEFLDTLRNNCRFSPTNPVVLMDIFEKYFWTDMP
jgi:hypothetical protein